MIRIAICDDEKNIRTYLSSLVRKQNIECEITEYLPLMNTCQIKRSMICCFWILK